MKKKSLIGAASAVGAAVILSTVGFAMPAQATETCWTDEYGNQCRTYQDSSNGMNRVKALQHPTFTGVLKAGQTLSALPGTWERAEGLKFQWLRDGVVIPGAAAKTYKLANADTGHSITLRVTGTNPFLRDGVETTLASPKVAATNTTKYTARPGITGEAPIIKGGTAVGSTLEASNLGTWSPGAMKVETEWQVDGEYAGITGPTYTVGLADLGKKITLKVTGSWPGEKSVSKSSAPVTVTKGTIRNFSSPTVFGETKVGNTLTVDRGYWNSEYSPASYAYQWLRDGNPISGATKTSYKLVAADKGHKVQVKVTGSARDYYSSSVVASPVAMTVR